MSGKWRIRKGDEVVVITGKDKGKKGAVKEVLRDRNRVVVQGVNVVKRHQKPSMTSAGGVVEKELSIHVSNVSHVDPESGKATRIGVKTLEDGTRVRMSVKSKQVIGK